MKSRNGSSLPFLFWGEAAAGCFSGEGALRGEGGGAPFHPCPCAFAQTRRPQDAFPSSHLAGVPRTPHREDSGRAVKGEHEAQPGGEGRGGSSCIPHPLMKVQTLLCRSRATWETSSSSSSTWPSFWCWSSPVSRTGWGLWAGACACAEGASGLSPGGESGAPGSLPGCREMKEEALVLPLEGPRQRLFSRAKVPGPFCPAEGGAGGEGPRQANLLLCNLICHRV